MLTFAIGLGIGILATIGFTSGQASTTNTKKINLSLQDAPGVEEKILFENDLVRVVRFHFEPHAIVPMHPAPDLVATWLSDGHFKLTHPDGTMQDMYVKAGQTEWFDAQYHSGENLGDTPLNFVVVQMKA